MNAQAQFLHRQPGWFLGAPFTKFLAFTTIATYVILHNTSSSSTSNNTHTDLIALDLEDLFIHKEFHRLFMYGMTFQSMGEIIMGLFVLLPLSRRFEREFGSEKYIAYSIKSCTLATVLQIFCLSDEYLATGPYPLIGMLMYLYKTYTPRLHPKFITMLGFEFSDKALVYLFAFQLVFYHGYASVVPFLAGYIAGMVSISKKTFLGRWGQDDSFKVFLPRPLYRLGYKVAKATGLEDLSHVPAYTQRIVGAAGAGAGGARGARGVRRGAAGNHVPPAAARAAGGGGAPAAAAARYEPMPVPDPPSEEAISQLTAMGFEREAVVRALTEADNNLEHAANRLLSGM